MSDDVKPSHLKEKYIDGKLDVNRLDDVAIERLKTDLGSYGFAGQFQQRPSPEDGGVWKASYIIPIADHLMPSVSDMTDYGTDWDTAYTKKETNASSAYVVSGLWDGKMVIDNIGWFNKEFPDLIKAMANLS